MSTSPGRLIAITATLAGIVGGVLAGCGGETRGACPPHAGERVMASSSHVVVLDTPRGTPLVCTVGDGVRRRFSSQATDSVAAVHGNFVAMVEDVCPGGFESCWLGLAVRRFPGGQSVTNFQWGIAVGSVAVSAEGALAFMECSPLEESTKCKDTPGGGLYRLDGRGLKRVAYGDDIPVHSVRGSPDGRSFSWIEHGRRRSAIFAGRPPRSWPPTRG